MLQRYVGGKQQPGIAQLEKLHAVGIDVCGIMARKAFFPGDRRVSEDWPMMEGSHAGNALLGLPFLFEFQHVLMDAISDRADTFVAKHHQDTGEVLSYRECLAVCVGYWGWGIERLREIATAPDVDVERIAGLSMGEVAYILLLGMPEAVIHAGIEHVRARAAS